MYHSAQQWAMGGAVKQGRLISGAQVKNTILGRSQNVLLTHEKWYPIMNLDPDALLRSASQGAGEILSKTCLVTRKPRQKV